MIVRRFARPYARAIMDVTGSAEEAGKVRLELDRFEQVRRASSDLSDMFANPGIETESKTAIANKIADRLNLAPMTKKVLEVLIRNHRINDLGAIAAALASYVNEATNTVVAEVRSAHELSDGERDELRKTLEKKFGRKVEVQLTKDSSLLGGFVARVGSEIYDASVAGKIEKFRESLS